MKPNKKLLYFLLILISAGACKSYDDSALKQEIENHEKRLSNLEAQCKTMNTEIVALRTLITAASEKDYITNITQTEDGYTISFYQLGDITISNGAAGKDGSSPEIGTKQEDGVYYWTINGEWLLADGKKVPVNVKGDSGAAPELKIEDGYWYVRYADGAWTKLGKAVAEASTGIFAAIDISDPYSVTFTLAGDNSTITIPRKVGFKIGTDLSNSTLTITQDTLILFTLPSNIKEEAFTAMQVRVVSEGGISVDVYTKSSGSSWDVTIIDPTFTNGVYNGDAGILLEPTSSNNNEVAILEAMIVWADGSKTEAARPIRLKSRPLGIYGVNSKNYIYQAGAHQINSYASATKIGFALVDPSAEKYFLISDLPCGLSVGNSASFKLTQNWTEDLGAQQNINATVKDLSNGYIYLQDNNNVLYIIKY